MPIVVTGALRRFLVVWRRSEPSELFAAIMRAHRVQTWFQRNRGVPMARVACRACRKERLFTIWSDGRYHCLACLYAQATEGKSGPIRLVTDEPTMVEFASSWLAYRSRVETFEEPWVPPSGSSLIKLMRIAPLIAPPICEIGRCVACEGLRPFMRREDGDAGCIHCLMQGRIVEFEIVHDETAAA